MIITKTPFRMSFFGGGTDMPSFFRENGGSVLSTTFDKYCYVNVRHLPRFFDYSTELSYSKTERVTNIEDIQHPAIKNAMKFLDMHEIRLTLKSIEQSIIDAYLVMEECYENGGKLLIAGNGGSAADSEHIAGELMKRFKTPRPVKKEFADKLIAIDPERGTQLANNLECSLMAIPLVAHEALTTAYINDVDGLGVFAQQLFGFGKEGDVFLGISTSGNSKNVLPATVVARALGIKVIGLTGAKGGELAEVADVAVKAPETETYMVQELHLPIYHCWCLMLEDKFFGV